MIKVWLYLKRHEEVVNVHDECLNPRVVRFVVCEVILKVKVLKLSRRNHTINSTSQVGGIQTWTNTPMRDVSQINDVFMRYSLWPVDGTFLHMPAILVSYNLFLLVNWCRRVESWLCGRFCSRLISTNQLHHCYLLPRSIKVTLMTKQTSYSFYYWNFLRTEQGWP